MSLGESISRLRGEQNLSQEALAEKLEVSRQSISKWENDSSVPELDKLVKLSDVFEVSLDELVLGRRSKSEHTEELKGTNFNVRILVGVVLLCAGFLCFLITWKGLAVSSLMLSSPLLLCGLICLIFQRRVGLWCGWAQFFGLDLYLRCWHQTNFLDIFHFERRFSNVGPEFVIYQFLCVVLLIGFTLHSFRNLPIPVTPKTQKLFVGGWLLLALLHIPTPSVVRAGARVIVGWGLVEKIVADVRLVLFIALLLTARALWRDKKGKRDKR